MNVNGECNPYRSLFGSEVGLNRISSADENTVAYSGVPDHLIRTNATGYSGVNATA